MKAIIFKDETQGAEWEEQEIPAEYLEKAQNMRSELLDELAVIDEDNEQFHDESSGRSGFVRRLTRIHQAIRKGVCENKFNPVLCGSALKNKGVQQLLDCGH